MEWLVPIIALAVGLAVLIVRVVRDARSKRCRDCPLSSACPLAKNDERDAGD